MYDIMRNVGDDAALSRKDIFTVLGMSKPNERKELPGPPPFPVGGLLCLGDGDPFMGGSRFSVAFFLPALYNDRENKAEERPP